MTRRGITPSGLPWSVGESPADRPEWLRPYALVTGRVSSAPLDLADRMAHVDQALRAAGWSVVRRSVGTDFANSWGIPVPKDQPVEYYLHRTDHSYTAGDAQDALAHAIGGIDLDYSPIGAWVGELATHVVVPTIMQADAKLEGGLSSVMKALPWVAAIAAAGAIIKVAPWGRRKGS